MNRTFRMVLISVLLLLLIVTASVRITEVTVTGNKWYTGDQVEELIFPTALSKNSAYCFLNGLMKKKQTIPFIEDYKITFVNPTKVEVIVYEKSIIGYVSYMSSYMYFDKDGIIVESSGKKLDGIPMVTGLKFGQIVLYKPVPVENGKIFSNILNLTQALSTHGIGVDLIRYDSSGNATLVIGAINVQLGNSTEMNGKISELSDILPKLAGRKGTLDLENYSPSSENPLYSFREK
jgi:cell division protein FtsQ